MSSFLDNFIGGMAFGMLTSNPFYRGCFGFGLYPMYNMVNFGGFVNPFPSIFGSGFYASSYTAASMPTTFANSSFPSVSFNGLGQMFWDTYTNPDSEYNKRLREYYENISNISNPFWTQTKSKSVTDNEKFEKTTEKKQDQDKTEIKSDKNPAYEFEAVYRKLNITDNRFKKIFEERVLKNEGREYIFDVHDMANCGIQQGTYNEYRKGKNLKTQDVKYLTQEEMCDIYYNMYYVKGGASEIKNDKLALYVFDTDVNMGVGKGKEILSQSGNNPDEFEKIRKDKYKSIAAANPKEHKKHLNGWLERVDNLKKYADKNLVAIA